MGITIMWRRTLSLAAVAALGLSAVLSTAHAGFYENKTVTLLINYGAGGSTDIEGRIIAQHLPACLPGVSNVIVKNMPGGGGNIAINFLGEAASKNGLTIGFFTWNPVDQLIGAPGLRVSYDEFDFIAGIAHPAIFYMRTDVEPGIEKPADLLKASRFKAGTYSPTIHQTIRTRLALDLLGVDYKLVSGYQGMAAVNAAMLRGEVQLSNVSLPGYKGAVEPTLVESGEIIPVFHFATRNVAGELVSNPAVLKAVGDIPTFLDLYRRQHGADAMPSGLKWQALTLLNSIMEQMYRIVVMPPNSPPEAVEKMRAASRCLAEDPKFSKAYRKATGVEPELIFGKKGQQVIQSLGEVDKEFVKFFKQYVGS